jgi:hypothetical protein
MNTQHGFRGARARFLRWAMAVGAVALIGTVLCGGSALAAGDPASSMTVKVKYFVVPRPVQGQADSLYEIAVQTLGEGSLYSQIFALNKGRLQPGGGMLENPRLIEPGWILQLPADAAGPGVHFGPLPTVTVQAVTGRQAASLPVALPSSLATGKPQPSGSLGAAVLAFGIVLFLVMVAALALSAVRRRGAEPTTAPRRAAGDPWMGALGLFEPLAESLVPEDDYPSWPGRPGPHALHPDHPSWPGRPDPRWAATEAGLRASDFPSWPVTHPPVTQPLVTQPAVRPRAHDHGRRGDPQHRDEALVGGEHLLLTGFVRHAFDISPGFANGDVP